MGFFRVFKIQFVNKKHILYGAKDILNKQHSFCQTPAQFKQNQMLGWVDFVIPLEHQSQKSQPHTNIILPGHLRK